MTGILYQGLDYTAALNLIKSTVKGRKKRTRLFEQVRLIEAGALSIINDPENVSDDAANSR